MVMKDRSSAGRLCSGCAGRFARRLLAAMFIGASPIHEASARDSEDSQLWVGAAAIGPIDGELGLFLFGESRFGDNLSRPSQTVLAVGLGWDPGGGRSIYGGYLLVNSYSILGTTQREHRLWQQLAYPLKQVGKVRISGRSLLEQRHVEGFDDIGLRFQQNVRAALPVDRRENVRLVAYGDLLLNLNGTDWGASAGIDQARGFGGANLTLSKSASLEMGYFHQHIVRRGRADHGNHVLLATFSHRFGQ